MKYLDYNKRFNPELIVAIGKPTYFEENKVGFTIDCKFMEYPIEVTRAIRREEFDNEEDHLSWFFKLVDGISKSEKDSICNMPIDWVIYFPKSICYKNIESEIDELWKIVTNSDATQ